MAAYGNWLTVLYLHCVDVAFKIEYLVLTLN